MTGMPVAGVPDTPVVPAPSRSGVGCAVSGLGCLLVFGALLAGAAAWLVIARDVAQPGRVQVVLLWCMVAAAVGVVLFFTGQFLSNVRNLTRLNGRTYTMVIARPASAKNSSRESKCQELIK